MVTMLIPLCKEIAKFQHSCWTTLKDSKMVLTSTYKIYRAQIEPKQKDLLICHLYKRWQNLEEHGM